jgi:hypothetical protein
MIFYSLILTLLLLQLPSATARTFTVVNLCSYTIWYVPAHFSCAAYRGVLTFLLRRSRPAVGAVLLLPLPPPSPKCSLRSTLTSPLHKMCRNSQRGVFQHLFLTTPLIYLSISRWESPPYTSAQFSVPDNWKSGRIWVRIFSFLPNSITARAWLHSLPDFCERTHARFFLVVFQGRRDCNFSTAGVNSCLDGGCNGGLQCDPHTGTVRHSLQYSRTPY